MTEIEAIQVRHAVRKYTTKPLSSDAIKELHTTIAQCNKAHPLHIQLIVENKNAFSGFNPLLKRFKNVNNYIAIITNNQDDRYEDIGYCMAQLMIKAQQLHLHSCCVTGTYNTKKVESLLATNEKLLGIIAIGYGASDGVPHTSKSIAKLCKQSNEDWFINGMKAAMLAPTGLNKQDFYIETNKNIVSIHNKHDTPLSKIGIGIVKHHFEIGAGKDNFIWES